MLRLSLADRVIETDRKAFVMGIVNATKDSFFSLSRELILPKSLLMKALTFWILVQNQPDLEAFMWMKKSRFVSLFH